jgi:hypothetical protein
VRAAVVVATVVAPVVVALMNAAVASAEAGNTLRPKKDSVVGHVKVTLTAEGAPPSPRRW